jgi:gliding motility-associated-like protein
MVEPPIAEFSFDTSVVLNQNQRTIQFLNQSIQEKHVGWIFEPGVTSIQENPTYTFSDTGLVQILLIATHEQGCKDTISKWLDIVPVVSFTMPNAFTPNGDSENDDFKGNGWSEYMQAFKMLIWNRWGELVFETENPLAAWDGTVKNNGKLCPDGIYTYTVSYTDSRGKSQQLKGQLHLMR